MDKLPVKFAEYIAPFCPRCRSGEYMTNEDGNENDFCGQCGTPLDWEHMENIETDEIVSREEYEKAWESKDEVIHEVVSHVRCEKCTHFNEKFRSSRGTIAGECNLRPGYLKSGTRKACKKFDPSIKQL